MFDLDQFEELQAVQSLDPTPDDGDITDIDWVEIGCDRILFPVLGGMFVPMAAQLLPGSAIPIAILGGGIFAGIAAMTALAGRQKFKWLFTLLAYVVGLGCGSWDWILEIASQDMVMGVCVLAMAFAVALVVCTMIKGIVRHG